MNDAAEEPSKPTSAEPGLRTVSDEELRSILKNHEKWLAAEDKTDLDDLRADLYLTDLRSQGTILRETPLQGAVLSRAQLQDTHLSMAQLQSAILTDAQLQGASLVQAQLQDANLAEAQLQRVSLMGAQLQRTSLNAAQLQGAVLANAQLQGAELNGAQLQGAWLSGTNLHKAVLRGANFEGLAVTEDGKPGPDLSAADVTDADFRDADLSNAQLSTVTGLRAEMLAGAVLTNAKLPEDIKKFDKLTHAGETSKHAGTTFFALLAASLYSWLTVGTTTDVALVTGAASSPLPIINTNIALSGFYWVAPLILLGVYLYLHLYLQRLWGDLASLPAVFPDGEALDAKVYPWLLNGLVRAHFAHLKLSDRPLSRLENLVSIALAWWVVPFTLVAFWLRYLPRHDWWGTGLHITLITIAIGFGLHSFQLAIRTLSGAGEPSAPGQDKPLWTWIWGGIHSYRPDRWTILAFSLALVLSVGAAIDPGDNLLTRIGYETYAELRDDDVSTKPSAWTGLEQNADEEIAQVKGADLEGRDLRHADAGGAFLVKAKLSGARLRGADFDDADLRAADFYDADLRDARLVGADLRGTDLRSADLAGANLISADLRDARLVDANLSGANLGYWGVLDPAPWPGPDLRGADLSGAQGLTQAQLAWACGDDETELPQGLTINTCTFTEPRVSPSPPTGSS